jgi:hypothetical protein
MKRQVLLFALLVLALGCASVPVQMVSPSVDSSKYEVLGEGTGSATGIMLFQFIPIKQNYRFERAYNDALSSRGGTKLLNPVISERWFWGYVLNGYTTTISGTVVKEK